MPNDPHSSSIRVLLGDFLGNAGVISTTGGVTQHGIRVEIFSRDVISTDFTLTESSAATGWNWGPAGVSAVRYPSEWSRSPIGLEQTVLQAAGVDTKLVEWWKTVQLATDVDPLPHDARLDPEGWAVHYDPYTFMPWINERTWRSEWPKYRFTDPAGVPATPLPRG